MGSAWSPTLDIATFLHNLTAMCEDSHSLTNWTTKNCFRFNFVCTTPIILADFHWINTGFCDRSGVWLNGDACVIIYSKLCSPIYHAYCTLDMASLWSVYTLCALFAVQFSVFCTQHTAYNTLWRSDKEGGGTDSACQDSGSNSRCPPRFDAGGKFHICLQTILTAWITMSTAFGV